MKRTRYISLIIALLSVLSITAQQQQSQYALYNYRNDGDFNAWLNIDIDSITYSTIGLDSIEYDNIVTQEVWTPDSCYRIPLEVIDSIGFRAPAPEFKEGIFHITEEHLPFAVGVDNLTVIFDSNIPSSMLPVVGQVVISDVYDEPFEKGFAGRVVNIVFADGKTRVECEEVGLEDIYDQLICVGKTIAYEDDDDMYSSRRKSPRKIRINEDGTVEVPLGKFTLDLLTYKEIDQYTQEPTGDKTNYVNVTAKPSLAVDYAIRYHVKGQENVFKYILSKKCEMELDMKWPKSIKPVDWEKYLDTFIPIPTSVPGLYSKICFGAYFQIEGDVRLEAKIPFTYQENIGIDTQSDNFGGIVYNIQGTKLEMPELSASLNASISIGLAAKVVTCIVTEKLASANIKVKTGPKISGKIEVSTNGITDGGWSWYESMKDSKITIEPLVVTVSGGMELFGKKKDWKYNLPMPDLDFLKKEERYLFPDFTKPELPHYLMTDPLDMRTTPHRDLIMPVYAGLGIYDEEGTQQRAYYSGEKYQIDAYYQRPPHVFIGDLPVGQKFTCRPIFNFPSLPAIGEIKALPITEFTVPEPMTIDLDTPLNSVTLKKGQVLYVPLNGGWGDYSAISYPEICTTEIIEKPGMPNMQRYVKIIAAKYFAGSPVYMTGSTTITVKDLRAGTTETILVTVTDDAVPEELTLSEQTVSLQVDESTAVLVTSGSGSYTAESSDESVATATVEDDKITITAISIGPAVITVTDTETEETATIEVTVKEAVAGGDIFDVGLPPSTTLSPEVQWEADMMIFNNGEKYYSEAKNQVIGTPPSDVNGNEWYALNYQLTNGEETWNVGKAPFSSDATYNGKPSTRWTTDGIMADIYLRRTFTVGHELPDNILFSCCHDDAPAEWYLNGVLIRSIDDGWNYDDKVYLTPEQCALIHTDGTKNVLALHVHNNWGGAFADGGLYEKPSPQKAINEILDNMVYVSGGTFMMGATEEQGDEAFDAEKPAHQVTVPSFYINRYEVTQEQWEAIMSYNNSKNKGDRHPVENFTYSECQTFIDKLSELTGKKFRLPTEAEWEYAARGGNKSRGYKYAGSNNIDEVAWYGGGDYNGGNGGNSGSAHHEVGLKKPNELGLYDMTGNVWEHTSDNYYPYEEEAVYNPKHEGGSNARIDRGGSYGWQPRYCRVSFRDNIISSYGKCDDNGFRLVLDTSEFGSGSGAGGGSGGSW